MSKVFGRLTMDNWGEFMPVHNSPVAKAPYYYRGTEALVVSYLTDEDAVLDLLPEDLELVRPATVFAVLETNHKCTLGTYSEIYTCVMCKWNGEDVAYLTGCYVTSETSLFVGREILGFGKKLAHNVELIRHGSGRIEAIVELTPGNMLYKVMAYPTAREPAETLQTPPLLSLKVIPDAEGGPKPALAQMVETTFKAIPLTSNGGHAEIYSGPAEVEIGVKSDCDMPVKEVLGCIYTFFDAEIAHGRILKTYT